MACMKCGKDLPDLVPDGITDNTAALQAQMDRVCPACRAKEKLEAETTEIERLKALISWVSHQDAKLLASLQDKLTAANCQIDAAKKAWADDLKWAMEKNARLIVALQKIAKMPHSPVMSDIAKEVLTEKQFCAHSEIMHNTRTDKHRCGICYEELDRTCNLCD